ncbi:hypothetical protein BH09BAC4_BH09BAC4_02980 [soil metagenome]
MNQRVVSDITEADKANAHLLFLLERHTTTIEFCVNLAYFASLPAKGRVMYLPI